MMKKHHSPPFAMSFTVCIFLIVLFNGCSMNKGQLSSPVTEMKEMLGFSQYYVKSHANLRAKPDYHSAVQGKVEPNAKVTEISRTDHGWSQVRVSGGQVEGWLPTSLLSQDPSAAATKKKKQSKADGQPSKPSAQTETPNEEAVVQPQEPAENIAPVQPAESEAREQPAESAVSKDATGGGVLSPAAAEAATVPRSTPKSTAPKERKADPQMFDAF